MAPHQQWPVHLPAHPCSPAAKATRIKCGLGHQEYEIAPRLPHLRARQDLEPQGRWEGEPGDAQRVGISWSGDDAQRIKARFRGFQLPSFSTWLHPSEWLSATKSHRCPKEAAGFFGCPGNSEFPTGAATLNKFCRLRTALPSTSGLVVAVDPHADNNHEFRDTTCHQPQVRAGQDGASRLNHSMQQPHEPEGIETTETGDRLRRVVHSVLVSARLAAPATCTQPQRRWAEWGCQLSRETSPTW